MSQHDVVQFNFSVCFSFFSFYNFLEFLQPLLVWCRQSFKNSKGTQYGAHMPSGCWILKQVFGEILVVVDMMTKPILPFTQQNFLLENLDGVRITMLVPLFDRSC